MSKSFGPTSFDDDVVQEAEELKHVPALRFCFPKPKWRHSTWKTISLDFMELKRVILKPSHTATQPTYV